MRLYPALPLLAAMALASCTEGERSSGDEIPLDEVVAGIEDNGTMPEPGEYQVTTELLAFAVAGATSIDMERLRGEFAAGAGEGASICVTEAMDRTAWLSAMTDNSCELARLEADGETIDLAMTCEAEDGPQGEITMSGTVGETSSDMEMGFTQPIAGHGEASVRMQVQTERTGDCA